MRTSFVIFMAILLVIFFIAIMKCLEKVNTKKMIKRIQAGEIDNERKK